MSVNETTPLTTLHQSHNLKINFKSNVYKYSVLPIKIHEENDIYDDYVIQKWIRCYLNIQ